MTPYQETLKSCAVCGEAKILSEFYKHKECRLGVRSPCKKCISVISSERYKESHPARIRKCKLCGEKFTVNLSCHHYCSENCAGQARKNSWLKHSRTTKGRATQERYRQSGKAKERMLKRRYNLTLEQHLLMYADQNGCCAICNLAIPYDKIVTDHDHETSKVRGLLCQGCNFAIGLFGDNPRILQTAVGYLA